MNRKPIVLAASLMLAILMPRQHAFAQQDSLLQRIYESYYQDDCSDVVTVMTGELPSNVAPQDRALGEIVHGACLFDRGDSTGAFAAFTRAITLDVSVGPDTTLFAPDRVSMYRQARAALPVVPRVEYINAEFRPLLQERMALRFPTEGPVSHLRVTLTDLTVGTDHILYGGPPNQTIHWNGEFGSHGILALSGPYRLSVLATDTSTGHATTFRKSLAIEVQGAVENRSLLPLPRVPNLAAESVNVWALDVDKKKRVRNRGLVTALAGAGVATLGYALSSSATGATDPKSVGRYASAGLYTGGIAIGVFGVVKLFQGILGNYRVQTVTFNQRAIAENQDARRTFRVNMRQAIQHNHNVVASLVMRVRFSEGAREAVNSGQAR